MEHRFYALRRGFATRYYWAEVLALTNTDPDVDYIGTGMRGFDGVAHLEITKGAVPGDLLGNGSLLYIVSGKVLDVLKEYRFSGYDTYSVDVTGGRGDKLSYHGLVFLGKGGHILPSESGVKYGPKRPDGSRCIMKMERLVFDLDQWDGSDFFYVEEFPRGGIITGRVYDAFKKHKITNCEFIPLDEYCFG